MKELQLLVSKKMEEMTEDGTIKKLISERVENSISEALNNAFRSYGAFSKALEKQVTESVDGSALRFDIEPYTAVMQNLVEQQIADHFKGTAQAQMTKRLNKIFEPIPESITVQELASMVAQSFRDDDYDDDRDDYMTLECEEHAEYGWFKVLIWKKKEIANYSSRATDPDIELHVGSDGSIRWLNGGSKHFGAANYGIQAKLYRMAAARTVISDIVEAECEDLDDLYIGIGED